MKERIKTIKSNNFAFRVITLLGLIFLSLLIIAINGLLFYSELQESVRISFAGDSEIYSEFEEFQGISYIDRGTKEIYIENTSFENVLNQVNELEADNENIDSSNYVVEEISAKGSLMDIIRSVMFVNIVVVISLGILIYYYQKISFGKIAIKGFKNFMLQFLASIIISFIAGFGFISLMSRLYRVKVIEVEMLSIIPMVLITLITIASGGDFENISDKVAKYIRKNIYKLYIFFFGFSIFLPLGLSGLIVIPLLMLILSILTSITVFYLVCTIQFKFEMPSRNKSESSKQKTQSKSSKNTSKKGRRNFVARNKKQRKGN